jgi:hypothetical protein
VSETEGKGEYVCEECGRKFESIQALRSHMGKAHGSKKEDKLKMDEIISMLNSLADRVKALEDRFGGVKTSSVERVIEVGDEPEIRKTVKLLPQTIQYYNYFISKTGSKMSIDEFINEVIDEHMRECLGVEVGIIVRPKMGGEGRRVG